MKQLIIARKDLGMSAGKLAAQVAHGSMAFLTNRVRAYARYNFDTDEYECNFVSFDKETYENWINGIFTKVVCEAKNRNDLLKVIDKANELGLQEGEDFWLIKDHCLTELKPEETDDKGQGVTLTCIGFRPLPDDICKNLSKKYQLYK